MSVVLYSRTCQSQLAVVNIQQFFEMVQLSKYRPDMQQAADPPVMQHCVLHQESV